MRLDNPLNQFTPTYIGNIFLLSVNADYCIDIKATAIDTAIRTTVSSITTNRLLGVASFRPAALERDRGRSHRNTQSAVVH